MIIVIKNNFILFEKKSCQNRNSHPWLLFCCLFGFCLLSLTFFSCHFFLPPLRVSRTLHAARSYFFLAALIYSPSLGGGERGENKKKSKRSLCSPTLSITPCLRLRTAARLLVKPRRVPPQKSARLDDPSRSPSRATSATLPHVSPINLPPGTPPAASRPLLCE